MWWCCGKKGKEQPGCKFGPHVEGEDEDEAEYLKSEQDNIKRFARCLCCKEIGHSIEKCDRDPNFKTSSDVAEEQKRLNQIRDFKKINADSQINTTHFFKKSVMLPVNFEDDGTEVLPKNAS